MRTALTVITTAILTAIAFLLTWQQWFLGNINVAGWAECPEAVVNEWENCLEWKDGVACTTPWWDTVDHGEAFLSFNTEFASWDTLCEGKTSICNNWWWLNDDAPFEFSSCELEATALLPKNCAVEDIMVAHDSTNTFYKEIRNGTTYTYEAQTRYCFDGELDGSPEFTKLNLISSCTLNVVEVEEVEEVVVAPAPVVRTAPVVTTPTEPVYARCTAPFWGVWTHGQAWSAFLQSNVPFGSSCQSTSVVCGFGSIRYGSADNIGEVVGQQLFADCSVGEPVWCTSSCGDVAHNGNITTYTNNSLAYGSDQSCSDIQINSTCSNGTLSPSAGGACSCEVQAPAACTAPNGQRVAHASSITLYKDETIQPVAWNGSDTCIREWARCTNGVFYDFNGNPTTLTFRHSSCTILPPPAGEWPGGEWVPN